MILDPVAEFLHPFQSEHSLLILGAGITGIALGDLLHRYRIPFSLYDRDLSRIPDLMGSEGREGRLTSWKPHLRNVYEGEIPEGGDFSDVILSPGIPRRELGLKGRVWNDVDFFYPLLAGKKLVGITGTDGKSTTVELTRHLLGDRAIACGNNDVPLSKVLEKILSPEIDTVVIEFSSYMLEELVRFRADVSMILNIAADHLDRYRDFAEYAEAKHHLLLHAREEDIYLHNLDDPGTAPRNPRPRVITYGYGHDAQEAHETNKADYTLEGHRYLHHGEVVLDTDPPRFATVLFPGNILPALIVAREVGVPPDLIASRLMSFPGLPHRLERVDSQNRRGEKITAYNNSKATTLQSVMASIDYLHGFHGKPIHIILGGKSKNIDYQPLSGIRSQVEKAYFYGDAGELIRKQSNLPGTYKYALAETVEQALSEIPAGGVLVLSPGCSSFDQFRNYRERGDFFREKVSGRK